MIRVFPKGALWVAFGSALWALDSIFRHRLMWHYPPFFLVFFSQLLCTVIVLPVCWYFRREILALPWRHWAAFLFLAVASNVLAMVAFTYAFKLTTNYSTPVLIQKLQPFISIFTAIFFLREKTPPRYYLYSALALAGSFLVGFGQGGNFSFSAQDLVVIAFSLLAALFWGVGTTLGRLVSTHYSFWMVTALRYGLAVFFMLLVYPFWIAGHEITLPQIQADFPNFLWMALVPGLLALFIYYRGLQTTRATLACWLELAYPIAAVMVNWWALGSHLSWLQILGAFLLLTAVSLMNYQSARTLGPAQHA